VNHCGRGEIPTMSNYFLQYSTFTSKRPQVRKWGCQTCLSTRVPSSLLRPCFCVVKKITLNPNFVKTLNRQWFKAWPLIKSIALSRNDNTFFSWSVMTLLQGFGKAAHNVWQPCGGPPLLTGVVKHSTTENYDEC